MRSRIAPALSGFALLFSMGCGQNPQPSASTHAAALRALREVEIAEEQAWIAKEMAKALDFYAADAVVLNPNAPAAAGTDQIRASMKPSFDDRAATGEYHISKVEVAQSGELGYTQGTYRGRATDPATGKLVNEQGKWLTVRKKQPDGSWKIVLDMYNSDLPVPAPAK